MTFFSILSKDEISGYAPCARSSFSVNLNLDQIIYAGCRAPPLSRRQNPTSVAGVISQLALAIEAPQAISVVKGGCLPNSHRQATIRSGIDAPSGLPT
jgi:hypothetical protein